MRTKNKRGGGWKIIPSIEFTNYKKEYGHLIGKSFNSWFSFNRFWSGKIININVKHYSLSIDFRKNWILDMVNV